MLESDLLFVVFFSGLAESFSLKFKLNYFWLYGNDLDWIFRLIVYISIFLFTLPICQKLAVWDDCSRLPSELWKRHMARPSKDYRLRLILTCCFQITFLLTIHHDAFFWKKWKSGRQAAAVQRHRRKNSSEKSNQNLRQLLLLEHVFISIPCVFP